VQLIDQVGAIVDRDLRPMVERRGDPAIIVLVIVAAMREDGDPVLER
jgi:hypothetical protein